MPSSPSPPPAAPLPARNLWRRLLAPVRWASLLLLALWSLTLIVWLILHWGILPRLDDWRPQIEQRVGAALGAPLKIGAIRVRSGGWIPAFELDDVRLLDRQGRTALSLGRVSAALSAASLWALEPRFAQLHVEGVALDIRRDTAGRLSVAGLELDGGSGESDPALLDWVFEQHEIVVRHGTLRWTDEQRGAPPLALADVDLVLRNGSRSHRLRVDATPPPAWGERLSLRGSFNQAFTARAGDWRRWRGTLFASLPLVDVSQLRRHVALPFELDRGRGALRGWFEWDRGRLARATADLALAEVALRLGRDLPPLGLQRLSGRIVAAQGDGGQELAVESLGFATDDGQPFEPVTWQLALEGAQDAAPTGGRFTADRVALAPLARLAARLPLPSALHQALVDLAPQGELRQVQIEWSGPTQAPTRYRAQARARALALAAGPPGPPAWGLPETAGRPGLRGADLEFQATETGGSAGLALRDGALSFPGVFAQAEVPLATLEAQLVWKIESAPAGAKAGTPPTLSLTVREARFASADARGELQASWRTGPGAGFGIGQRWPGVIDLKGKLTGGDPTRVARYLPLGVPASARAYVARSIGPGRIVGGDFAVQGDLWRFPFVDGSPGTFRLRAQVDGLRYAFLPDEEDWRSPWPAMEDVVGEIEFDRAALRIKNVRGAIGGIALRGVNGGIADLVKDRVLQLDGQARGTATELLRFVETTPVGGWLGGALSQATATGSADLTLALTIPIRQPERGSARGSVVLAGNDVRMRPDLPLLAQSRAKIDFGPRGLTLVGGRARALGGDVVVEGSTQADGSLRFSAQGQATAEAMLKELPWIAPLAGRDGREPRLRGSAPYRLQLGFVQGRPEWRVDSPLTGMTIDLPAPLAKAAAASWPLRLQVASGSGASAGSLQLDLGEALRARYELDTGGEAWRIERGALALGAELPPLPEAGVTAQIRLARLDVDAWRSALAAGPATADAGPEADWLPTRTLLRVADLTAGGRRYGALTAEIQRRASLADSGWRMQLIAEQAEGSIEWRQPRDPTQPGRLQAQLSRLVVPPQEAGVVEQWLEQAPSSVPALQLTVDDFSWRGRSLGRLEVSADNRIGRAGAREWQLDQLKLATPEATLLGRGVWSAGQRSSLAFDIAIADGGKFFERVGAGRGVAGGKGRIEGELSWPGSPLAPDPMKVRGRFSIALGEGRFLNAEPGMARLFGVLSLQALPRRLLLDFRDVFQQGLQFDKITGDVTLDGGVARTQNLKVLGVQAAVAIAGSADLRTETQDLRIVAVPELNAGTASLAWAALANPAVGLGAFVAQLLLSEPMKAATTREFHVTGPWADPRVERVERVAAAEERKSP
jgi:uncharacterized protein (TIGR02099 family)